MRRSAIFILLLLLALVGCGGGGGGGTGPEPETAATLTADGWQDFEADDMVAALADFDAALALDADYGPALAGRAWVVFLTAETDSAMLAAIDIFDDAVTAGENEDYALAGRAAARLGAGLWTLAVSGADAALSADADFVFAHRSDFDHDDLHLIVAFAQLAQGDLEEAIAAADEVTASGLDPTDPGTWVVEGTSRATWTEAVLAHLNWLSSTHSD